MKIIYCILITIVINGCSGKTKLETLASKSLEVQTDIKNYPQELLPEQQIQNTQVKPVRKAEIIKHGIIFAKTDFQGVLKRSYVRLVFENIKTKMIYQLFIGDKSNQTFFSWGLQTVEPGYFFINLPEGQYKISSVAIPVGSTMAVEDLNIILEVKGDVITYAGTLKIDGTKERVKMGGVPVIRPGFDFNADIIDEQKEGVLAFRARYPKVEKEILINLMKFNNL